ncbi:hypothetical protein D3C86_1892380 [compost metagenome]
MSREVRDKSKGSNLDSAQHLAGGKDCPYIMNILDIRPSDRQSFTVCRVYRHEADVFIGFEEKFFDHALAVGSSNHHILARH